MKPLKRLIAISAIMIFFMLVLPVVSVNTVKADAGMASVLIMFFAINPVVSIVTGIVAGADIKHFWVTPLAVAVLFWVFSSLTHKTAFPVVYSLIYFAICGAAMLITHFVNKAKSEYTNYKNKKTHFFTLCLVFALLLCSCAKQEPEKADVQITPEPEMIEEPEMTESEITEEYIDEPVYISPFADENFLLPLENFSWEREYNPEYVVIHFTSDVVNNPQNPFDMGAIRNIFVSGGVSINYIIDRYGAVQCWIPEDRAAWHAGRGTFAGDEKYTNAMNKYSIGIEIAAIGSQKDMAQYLTPYEYSLLDESFIGYTDEQYETLKSLVKDVCERNGIPFDRQHVIGHEEYNPDKNDPGELFDWERLFEN